MRFISLGQLFELKYGKSLRKDRRVQGKVPVYGSNGVVDTHNESIVNKSTIVVGRKGSIGEVHLVSTPCWPIDTTYFIESRGNYDYDLEWIYRLLKTLRLQDLNRAAAIPGLNRDDVYKIKVNLPPLEDQKRIAHLLSKVEGLIAQRKQHLEQLDDLLKSTFLEMFGDPVRNEMGWVKDSFDNISESRLGKMRDKKLITGNHLRKYIGNSNVQWFRFVLNELLEMDFNEREREIFKLEFGDLLVCEGGDIGRCAIWKNNIDDCYFQKALHRVRLVPQKAIPEYAQFVLFFYSLLNGFKTVKSKSTIAHLTGEKLKETKIPLPPIDLQNKFAVIVDKVEGIKSRYQQSLTDLENLYGALSQKAFKGELDLSRVVLPTEQPEPTEGKQPLAPVTPEVEPSPTIELPVPINLKSLTSVEGRKEVIEQWLNSYLKQLGNSVFSAEKFMKIAQQRLWELLEDEVSELSELGIAEYDQLKAWVFQALENGRLTQFYDDAGNRVQLKSAMG